jgi:hypothetical protein
VHWLLLLYTAHLSILAYKYSAAVFLKGQSPISLDTGFKSSIAGESAKQALQLEYIIKQSIKSVSI